MAQALSVTHAIDRQGGMASVECGCAECGAKRQRELEALIDSDLLDRELAPSAAISNEPRYGRYYTIEPADPNARPRRRGDTLFGIVQKLMPDASEQERLTEARRINNAPYNLRFRDKTLTDSGKFPEGRISFNPKFSCDVAAQKAATDKAPKGRCFATIWLPSRESPRTDPKPKPNRPDNPASPKLVSCDDIKAPGFNVQLIYKARLDAIKHVNDARMRLEKYLDFPDNMLQKKWNAESSDQRTWFGTFEQSLFKKILANFALIAEVLNSPKLTIRCKKDATFWGSALPNSGKNKEIIINLGGRWFGTIKSSGVDLASERIQTLIHEAAHIVGVTNVRERSKYGPCCSKKLALASARRAARNADNYGYYALAKVPTYMQANPAECKRRFLKQRP